MNANDLSELVRALEPRESITLGDAIQILASVKPKQRVQYGFTSPHSYRGYYDQLAVEPTRDTTAGHMMAELEGAVGSTFSGYKGGDYTMDETTPLWLADYGDTGEPLTATALCLMLGITPPLWEERR